MTTPELAQSLPAPAEVGIPWLRAGSLLVAAVICVPVVAVFLNLLIPRADTWRHLASTVLPDYVINTALLVVLVGFGVVLLGVGCAWLTSMCRFPLARIFEWALLLPLAMPAYVMAYVYTDFLQFAGPLQGTLRAAFGWQAGDYWFPDVRSLGGAAFVLSFVLYPYVYLLARAAFLEQSASALETARILGESSWRSFWSIALPLARPAVVAGTALCLMETLADYGTVAYFGVDTFSTGIFRAWFSMGDPVAAAQLGALLLAAVGAILALERLTRGRAAFHSGSRRRVTPHELRGARSIGATLACGTPLLVGFALPAALLLRLVLQDEAAVLGLRFARLAWNSLTLAGAAALLAVACALAIAYALRLRPGLAERAAHRIAGLGYAVPGVVIAVGVMVPLTRLDQGLAGLLPASVPAKLVLSGTVLALLYAYLVRFLAVALQSIEAGLARIKRSMDDAARSLGAGPAATLARVHAPLLAPSLLAATLLVFVDVMKELPATLALRPFDFDTLAVQTFNLAKDERLAEASLPALAIVLVGLIPVYLLARSMARR
ncbi:MAG: iron ABC transporter permease [Betaproteobacteria bacterium]|nr:MAG: iron ABC transporter permease [Betaproteobacteria bacterium]